MRKLTSEKRAAILSALFEGNSINAACRMTGASKVTVLRLLADAGTFCAQYHDLVVRDLQTKRAQLDELWSFCGCKDKAKSEGAGGFGSVWTWVALDADSKLCISYLVGLRDGDYAKAFVSDVADRLASRIQLTTDGFKPYINAVESAFEGKVDYAMLVKQYGAVDTGEQRRYSPAECIGCKREALSGAPDLDHVSTSFVERQNLTVRMSLRRFTRLTNAFSKKVENHEHAVALHYFYYNFIRKHQTLRTTPALASGVTDCEWTWVEFVKMMEAEEVTKGGRLTNYKPAAAKLKE